MDQENWKRSSGGPCLANNIERLPAHSNTRIKQSTRSNERVYAGGLLKRSAQKAESCWQPIRPTLFKQRATFAPPLIARNVKALDFGNYAPPMIWQAYGIRKAAVLRRRTC